MSNIDNLLLNINDMTKSVDKQIADSVEELRTQTRMLTFHDQLISDEMLLSLPPDILRNSLPNDEFDEFLEKYPDYAEQYNLNETTETVKEKPVVTETVTDESVANELNKPVVTEIITMDDLIKDETAQSSQPISVSDEDILKELPDTEDKLKVKEGQTEKKENKWKNPLITIGIIGAIVLIVKLLLTF